MARWARRPRATNATIRAFYRRGRFLAARGVPTSLKLTMMGMGRRGGVLLRQEKLRRRIPAQMRGAQTRTKRLLGE